MVEIRAVRGDVQSLPVLVEVTGMGSEAGASGMNVALVGFSIGLLILLMAGAGFMLRQGTMVQGDEEEIVEAEILEEENLFSLTVVELKQRLAEQGLPVSGNKGELIARLTSQTA